MNRLPREFVRLVDYTYKYEREIPAYTSTACSLRGHITLAWLWVQCIVVNSDDTRGQWVIMVIIIEWNQDSFSRI